MKTSFQRMVFFVFSLGILGSMPASSISRFGSGCNDALDPKIQFSMKDGKFCITVTLPKKETHEITDSDGIVFLFDQVFSNEREVFFMMNRLTRKPVEQILREKGALSIPLTLENSGWSTPLWFTFSREPQTQRLELKIHAFEEVSGERVKKEPPFLDRDYDPAP